MIERQTGRQTCRRQDSLLGEGTPIPLGYEAIVAI